MTGGPCAAGWGPAAHSLATRWTQNFTEVLPKQEVVISITDALDESMRIQTASQGSARELARIVAAIHATR